MTPKQKAEHIEKASNEIRGEYLGKLPRRFNSITKKISKKYNLDPVFMKTLLIGNVSII